MLVEAGSILEGKVISITNFGAFILLPDGTTGLVHISEVAEEYVKDIRTYLKENQVVKVKVISIDANGKISLSIKKAQTSSTKSPIKSSRPIDIDWSNDKSTTNMTFEERLAKYMKESDEKLHDLKKNFESKRGSGSGKRSAQ